MAELNLERIARLAETEPRVLPAGQAATAPTPDARALLGEMALWGHADDDSEADGDRSKGSSQR